MSQRPLFWKLYPWYLIIIVASLGLSAWFGASEMRKMYDAEVTETLEARARIVASNINDLILHADTTGLNNICKQTARFSDSRITIISLEGVVLADSHEDPAVMENHGQRPEILMAYSGEVGVSTRYSNTLQTMMKYVAIPLTENSEVVAVVRASLPVSEIDETVSTFYRNILMAGLIILFIAGVVSFLLTRKLTAQLRALRDGAARFADGKLDTRLVLSDVDEIADLSLSMNRMAAQLDSRIRTIAEQRNEREAILSSMTEGVIALDNNEKIVSLNREASRLLGIVPDRVRGRAFYEVVRVPALLEFAERAVRSAELLETEIELVEDEKRYLQVRAATLRDNRNERVGTVFVLADISRLKKLENLRREFVANVSHELKTPVTAITGSVETLLADPDIAPEDSRRFLEMIARQSGRLNSLIEDLLKLARLESEAEVGDLSRAPVRLVDVLEAAVSACSEEVKRHQAKISLSCDNNIEVNVNRGQIEQAIINLLDNAIRYSITLPVVSVRAAIEKDRIVISVSDNGPGIASEHLPRLFERFYRVDKARSREAGGTGLGLAIVKHIALAHNGSVSVESTPGEGSTFYIYLPV